MDPWSHEDQRLKLGFDWLTEKPPELLSDGKDSGGFLLGICGGAGTRQVTGALPQNAMYPPTHNQKDPTMVWFSYKSSTTKLWTKTVGRALP